MLLATVPAGTASALRSASLIEAERDSPIPLDPNRVWVHLRYTERSPVRVRGLRTGGIYLFSGTEPVQPVDERDVSALLQTPHFRRA